MRISRDFWTIFSARSGNEFDLLAEIGRNLCAVEIRSDATFNRYYFKGLRHFTGGVIYGGDEVQKRSGFPVYPVTQCEGLVAEQEGSQRFLFQKIE